MFDGLGGFVKILIVIGLMSVLYMFVMQKIREQNHKINTMMSLVTEMAEDLQRLKTSGDPVEQIPSNLILVSDDSSEESFTDSESECDSVENISEFIFAVNLSPIPQESRVEELDTEPLQSEPEIVETLESEMLVETLETLEPEILVETLQPDIVETLTPKKYSESALKKMNLNQLIDLAVSYGNSLESVQKLKKASLLQLLA